MNYDNLASCVGSQDILKDNFKQAVDSLNRRTDDDVAVAVTHLQAIFLGLENYVTDCSDQTKEQVDKI